MRIRIQPQALSSAIAIAQRAVAGRATMSILTNIRLEAGEQKLQLTSTDLERSIQTTLPCEVEETGVVVLPSTIIGNIFRKLPAGEALLSTNGDMAEIDCGNAHFRMQLSNASDFPTLPEEPNQSCLALHNDVLRRAIIETGFATSLDENKLALTGIFVEKEDDHLRFVALDGYRLAVRTVPIAQGADVEMESFILPKRAMDDVLHIFPDMGLTTIRRLPGTAVFEDATTRFYARLIDKKYINYREIISTEFRTKVDVNRQGLVDALERATLLSNAEHANLVKLFVDDSLLRMESNSELGTVNESLAVHCEGEAMRIAFNAGYLLQGLKALDCEEVRLHVNGSLNPMVIRPVDEADYLYLVLPVRVGGA